METVLSEKKQVYFMSLCSYVPNGAFHGLSWTQQIFVINADSKKGLIKIKKICPGFSKVIICLPFPVGGQGRKTCML